MQEKQKTFIIAIDLGTTYSAAAWALSSDPDRIEIVRGWPTKGQLVGVQVPTEIAYNDETGSRVITWGYDIGPRDRKIKWFKLGLETAEELISLPHGLDTITVARDYLHALHGHVITTIGRRFTPAVLQAARFDYILTVPAIWSDAAKKRTEKAALDAGLGGKASSLELLSEPESAAIYSLKTIEDVLRHITIGDKLIVCDAGGGTVDLISYELRQIEPSLQLIECTTGTGDFCGASFVDREFEKLFRKRMGPRYEALSVIHRLQVVKNFESSKIAFRDDEHCPKFYVSVPGQNDIPEAGVYDGSFEISRDEMRALFDPIIWKIIELIQKQAEMAASQYKQVNLILLVGGFGESEYLYQKTRAWAMPLGIQVLQPRDAATAVVQGAVLRGLEPKEARADIKTKLSRRARRCYGVVTKQEFNPSIHWEQDSWIDPVTQKKYARHQVHWFIKTNQLVEDDQTFRHRFARNVSGLEPWIDNLVSCPSPTPPNRMQSDVHQHCSIKSDITQLSLKRDFQKHRKGFFGKPYYSAEYDLVLSLRNNNLTLSLSFNGRQYGIGDVEFESTANM